MMIALAMYSRIPIKRLEWTEENMRYSLCFVPLVGAVVGLLVYGCFFVGVLMDMGQIFPAFVGTVIPILVTGGIHMDGFCDTVDAIASYRTREKRLEILKDPHIGSFAVMAVCCYLLLQAGAFSMVQSREMMAITALDFILSRCVGCLMAAGMHNARGEGTLAAFCSAAHKSTVAAVLVTAAIFTAVGIILLQPFAGMFLIFGMALAAGYCVRAARRYFGGVTGDIVGFTIQVAELAGIIMAIVGERLWSLL